MIACPGRARPLDRVEFVRRPDDDYRDDAAVRLRPQTDDKFRCLAVRGRGCGEDKVGVMRSAEPEGGLGFGKAAGDRLPAQRMGQPFEDLQIGDAVIDDDHQL